MRNNCGTRKIWRKKKYIFNCHLKIFELHTFDYKEHLNQSFTNVNTFAIEDFVFESKSIEIKKKGDYLYLDQKLKLNQKLF